MTKYHIDRHEHWPFYELENEREDEPDDPFVIDLTDEERADYDSACAKWEAWQARIEAAYYPTPPK